MRIRLSKKADADLDEIWLFLANESQSESVATRAVDQIAKSFDLLVHFPYAGRACPSAKYADLRRYSCADYLIYYRVGKGALQIIRVLHGKRNLSWTEL